MKKGFAGTVKNALHRLTHYHLHSEDGNLHNYHLTNEVSLIFPYFRECKQMAHVTGPGRGRLGL